MTKREAIRAAHRIAYSFVQKAIDDGFTDGWENDDGSLADQQKIDDALDRIAQRHFELGASATPKTTQEQTKDARGDNL